MIENVDHDRGQYGRSHQISDWDPEDSVAWEAGNKFIARRNLIWSVAAEHVGFSVWSSGR